MAIARKRFPEQWIRQPAKCIKIAKLRFDRAQLLGYATHAHFVLEERMAESPESKYILKIIKANQLFKH
jgi:peptidyl-dipeptidase Dcp